MFWYGHDILTVTLIYKYPQISMYTILSQCVVWYTKNVLVGRQWNTEFTELINIFLQ